MSLYFLINKNYSRYTFIAKTALVCKSETIRRLARGVPSNNIITRSMIKHRPTISIPKQFKAKIK